MRVNPPQVSGVSVAPRVRRDGGSPAGRTRRLRAGSCAIGDSAAEADPEPLQVRNELAAPALGAPNPLIFLFAPMV